MQPMLLALAAAACAPAPPATVTPIDEDGLRAMIADPEPALLVVNTWATWCSACRGELGAFDEVARARPDVGFALVSLDAQDDLETAVRPYATGVGLTAPVFHLQAAEPFSAARAVIPGWSGGIPFTMVVSGEGEVLETHGGRLTRGELEAMIERAD